MHVWDISPTGIFAEVGGETLRRKESPFAIAEGLSNPWMLNATQEIAIIIVIQVSWRDSLVKRGGQNSPLAVLRRLRAHRFLVVFPQGDFLARSRIEHLNEIEIDVFTHEAIAPPSKLKDHIFDMIQSFTTRSSLVAELDVRNLV
jgi:hypothetical protein